MIFNVYSSDVQNIFHMGAVTRNSRKKDQTSRKMLPELCKSQHLLNSQECNNPTLLQCKCHGGCTCACRLGGLFHSHHFWHCHGVTDWLVQIVHSPFRRSRHHRLGRHRPALLLHHGLHIGIGQVVRSDGRHQGNKTWTICVFQTTMDHNSLFHPVMYKWVVHVFRFFSASYIQNKRITKLPKLHIEEKVTQPR